MFFQYISIPKHLSALHSLASVCIFLKILQLNNILMFDHRNNDCGKGVVLRYFQHLSKYTCIYVCVGAKITEVFGLQI